MVLAITSMGVFAQPSGPAPAVLYEGARLIIGDATPVIESGAFLVQDGQIRSVGARGAVTAPAGAVHVDLTGKTVMPAMVNVHVHIYIHLNIDVDLYVDVNVYVDFDDFHFGNNRWPA